MNQILIKNQFCTIIDEDGTQKCRLPEVADILKQKIGSTFQIPADNPSENLSGERYVIVFADNIDGFCLIRFAEDGTAALIDSGVSVEAGSSIWKCLDDGDEVTVFGSHPETEVSENVEELIKSALQELGIPAHIRGRNYLELMVADVIRESEMAFQATKNLYPETAKLYGKSWSCVERSVRYAIGTGWEHTDHTMWQDYGFDGKKKPKNMEFIVTLANAIRHEVKNRGKY